MPHSFTEGMRCCSFLVYDLRGHPLWCSRTIVSKFVHVSFCHIYCTFPSVYLYLFYSLALCVSPEYTQNIYHHILKMDCAVGRGGGDHLIVPFKFTFNRIGEFPDIIATGIPMWTGAV